MLFQIRLPKGIEKTLGGPDPVVPGRVDLRAEARIARHRLYPSTFLYVAVFAAVLGFGRPASLITTASAVALGFLGWTLLEYLVHRYVLHGRFENGPGVRGVLHRAFDHLHVEHHARPWDGRHVNGTLKDTLVPALGFFAIALALGSRFALVVVASLLLFYVVEEWVHHSVHFYAFRGRYFRYIRSHHMKHHALRGPASGYGLTSDVWDRALGTPVGSMAAER